MVNCSLPLATLKVLSLGKTKEKRIFLCFPLIYLYLCAENSAKIEMQIKKTGVLGLLALTMVLLLAACGESHEAMLRQLEMLEQMNRADSVMTNDSLAEALTNYFDSHGTANERLRAHYILGRTYADMGEAPAALNAYLDAADCADTTAADCDYRILSRVYGQMADVFYWQNLMEDYIKACEKSIVYAWKDKDTLQALNVEAHIVAAYNRLEQYDKVIASFDTTYNKLLQTYGVEYAAKFCILPVNALLERGCLQKAKMYLDIVERESGYFDSLNNIEKGREGYYYYKGRFFMATQQFDSAEYYFRKELRTGLDVTNQSMASRGLSLMFEKTHRPDSAAKYAIYSYEMNDSVYAQMATKEVEQAKASYNYQRNKELAAKERQRAEQEKERARRNLYIIILLVAISSYTFIRLLRRRRIREKAYQAKEQELEHALRETLILRSQAEQVTQILKDKESALTQQSEELEELRANETALQQMIIEREASLERLHDELKKLNRHIQATPDEEGILGDSPIYQMLHKKTDAGKKLTDEDISQLYTLVREVLPVFYQFITNKKFSLNEAEYNVCVLFRLHVKAFGASVLLDKSPAAITKISKAVMEKLFGESGNSRELIEKLSFVC